MIQLNNFAVVLRETAIWRTETTQICSAAGVWWIAVYDSLDRPSVLLLLPSQSSWERKWSHWEYGWVGLANLIWECVSATVVVRARCGGKKGEHMGNVVNLEMQSFRLLELLHAFISEVRQEALEHCGCFQFVLFLLVYVVRIWSHVYRLTQDTAGSERYEAMSRIYYRGARAAIVCYGQTLLFCKTQPPVSFFIVCQSSQRNC